MLTKNLSKKAKRKLMSLESRAMHKYWPGNKDGKCWTVKKTLHLVQHGKCFYCLNDVADAGKHCTIDHIIPKCRGGTRNFLNVVLACADCNNLKGDSEVNAEWVKERLEYFCGGAKGDPWPDLN